MAKIRHIAIKVEDQEKVATFYKETFGMTEAWRGPVREDGNRAIYLTDGYINMAVLPARGGREGIDHFGFQVENMDATLKTANDTGAWVTWQDGAGAAVHVAALKGGDPPVVRHLGLGAWPQIATGGGGVVVTFERTTALNVCCRCSVWGVAASSTGGGAAGTGPRT